MKTKTIIDYLRELQAELEPFTHGVNSGAQVWDGTKYVKAESKPVDVFALNWWTAIRVASDLLEAQNRSPNDKQLEYIEAMICGGMGSLADYQIDENKWGERAIVANEKISRIRGLLHQVIQLLK